MGYNQRNDEIRDNIERMRREREAYADALATVRQFNARLSAKKPAWFWPTIAAALDPKPRPIGIQFVIVRWKCGECTCARANAIAIARRTRFSRGGGKRIRLSGTGSTRCAAGQSRHST